MKILILIVEDKKEEQNAAIEAIKKAFGPFKEHGRSEVMGHVYLEGVNGGIASGEKEGGLIHVAGDLKTALAKLESVAKVSKALESFSLGVITDLMFPSDVEKNTEEPNGLVIIAKCIEEKLPVVVCSDTDHHDIGWLRPLFPILGQAHPLGNIPVILDKKDWEKASRLLKEACYK